MADTHKILDYLADSLSMGFGANISSMGSPEMWELAEDDLTLGILGATVSTRILNTFFAAHPSLMYGSVEVPVIIGLRFLRFDTDDIREPVLMIRATLDAHGHLHAIPSAPFWIPETRIRRDGCVNEAVTVCDLDTYRTYQYALSGLDGDEGLAAVIRHATGMFDAVCDLNEEKAARLGVSVEAGPPTICIAPNMDEGTYASAALRSLSYAVSARGDESLSAPLRRMIGARGKDEAGRRLGSDVLHDLYPNDPLVAHKMFSGMPGGVYTMDEARRSALAAAACAEDDAVLIQAEAGADRVGLSIATVSNLVTEAALRGDAAHAAAIVAPRDVVNEIADRLARLPVVPHASPCTRWIPRIATDGKSDASVWRRKGRVLGPLQTMCAIVDASQSSKQPASGNAILYDPNFPEESAIFAYGREWYVVEATSYYLDRVSAFFGTRLHSLADAAEKLSERLRMIDQLRCELLDAQDAVCRASVLLLKRDELTAMVASLRERHATLRERLSYWEGIRDGGGARTTLAGMAPQLEEAFVAANAEPNELLAQEGKTLTDVTEAYISEMLQVEQEIESCHAQIQEIMYGTRLADEQGRRVTDLLARLIPLCRLESEQITLLEAVVDSGATSLEALEEALDGTVRSVEFWLSVHVFEGRWLRLRVESHYDQSYIDACGRDSLRDLSYLVPFILIPSESSDHVLLNEAKDAPRERQNAAQGTAGERTRPLDQIILPEAGSMSSPMGAALLAVAERALLMGPGEEDFVRQPLGTVADMVRADRHLSREEWRELRDSSLSSSGGSSTYAATYLQDAMLCGVVPARTSTSSGYVIVPDSFREQYGASRRNIAEAFAAARWLRRKASSIKALGAGSNRPGALIVTPYSEQARILRAVVAETLPDLGGAIEVATVDQLHCGMWRQVVVSPVATPKVLQGDLTGGFAQFCRRMEEASQESVVWFFGPSWRKTSDEAARKLIDRSRYIGRLYALPRKRASQKAEVTLNTSQPQLEPQKNLSLSAMSIEQVVETLESNDRLGRRLFGVEALGILESYGLVARQVVDGKRWGWEPAETGKEVGIVLRMDPDGQAACEFLPSSLPAVTLALTMSG